MLREKSAHPVAVLISENGLNEAQAAGNGWKSNTLSASFKCEIASSVQKRLRTLMRLSPTRLP